MNKTPEESTSREIYSFNREARLILGNYVTITQQNQQGTHTRIINTFRA